ncbi:GQ67_03024T0 [Komagataella phaffii]|nr:GQ67_03024T0 [Komagataella phaffii]AOA68711.1 GQ68_03009T0 [Komagataella phaffii GS115]
MKRTRAHSACEHCRLKKTKCDEARPSCSQCKTRNLQCTYKDSVPTKLERTLSLLFQRIENENSKLESLFNQETANKKPLNCSVGDKSSVLRIILKKQNLI